MKIKNVNIRKNQRITLVIRTIILLKMGENLLNRRKAARSIIKSDQEAIQRVRISTKNPSIDELMTISYLNICQLMTVNIMYLRAEIDHFQIRARIKS